MFNTFAVVVQSSAKVGVVLQRQAVHCGNRILRGGSESFRGLLGGGGRDRHAAAREQQPKQPEDALDRTFQATAAAQLGRWAAVVGK
jgi:hypothetical protein